MAAGAAFRLFTSGYASIVPPIFVSLSLSGTATSPIRPATALSCVIVPSRAISGGVLPFSAIGLPRA